MYQEYTRIIHLTFFLFHLWVDFRDTIVKTLRRAKTKRDKTELWLTDSLFVCALGIVKYWFSVFKFTDSGKRLGTAREVTNCSFVSVHEFCWLIRAHSRIEYCISVWFWSFARAEHHCIVLYCIVLN